MGLTLSPPFYQPKHQTTAEQHSTVKVGENHDKVQALWVPTDSVGLYTLVLAAFTGLLVGVSVFQGVMLLRAEKTTRIAANAADLSARAAIAIELPILRVRGSQIELADIDEGTDLNGPYASVLLEGLPRQHSVVSDIEIKNFGRTHAFPIHVDLGFSVGELPKEPAYIQTSRRPGGAVIEPNEPTRMEVHFGIHLTPEQVLAVQAEETILWLYFSVAYRDFMNTRHDARFCYYWGRPDGVGIYYFAEGAPPEAYTRHT